MLHGPVNTYKPQSAIATFLQGGGEMGRLILKHDWSKSSLGEPEIWPQNLLLTLSILLHSKFPMFLFWGPQNICFYNDAYRPSLGNNGKHPNALGKAGKEVWPEIWADIEPLINKVMEKGESNWSEDQLLPIYRNGKIEDVYWTFSYSPVIGLSKIDGVFVTCVETTTKVTNQQRVEESERSIRDIILHAPVAMCILRGPEFVVETANDRMLDLWGKNEHEMLNKPIFSSLPGIRQKGLEELLNEVYTSGKVQHANELAIDLPCNEQPENLVLNFVCQPIADSKSNTSGVLVIATDISQVVTARSKIEEAEKRSRLAVETAELGIIEIDLKSNTLVADERMFQIFGVKTLSTVEQFIELIHPDDRLIRQQAYERSYKTGFIDYEVRLLLSDNTVRWIRTRGNLFFDEHRIPVRILGVIQEITKEKHFAETLENKVNERTSELAEANLQLQQSNIELNQFAYIASHDLQEPLRKVRTFTNLLANSLDEIPPKAQDFIKKIENSTERMQTLINDVLRFSQLSKEREKFTLVDLNLVLRTVKRDYELLIQQKKAQLILDELPELDAIPLQMSQLFTNLLSNALKFSRADVPPIIKITVKQLESSQVRIYKELNSDVPHYQIDITDNGIGFDPLYAQQIFTIFQRLHGKKEYSGTGIGLAMCKKIVANHHGAIYAESSHESGATFTILLPAVQLKK